MPLPDSSFPSSPAAIRAQQGKGGGCHCTTQPRRTSLLVPPDQARGRGRILRRGVRHQQLAAQTWGQGASGTPASPSAQGLASRPQKQTAEQGVTSRVLTGLGRAARAEARGGAAREKPCEGKEASVTRATSQRVQNNRAMACTQPAASTAPSAPSSSPTGETGCTQGRCSPWGALLPTGAGKLGGTSPHRQPQQSPTCRPGEEPQQTGGRTPGHAKPGASRNTFAFDFAWLARANGSR